MAGDAHCKAHQFWFADDDTCPTCDGMELMRQQIIVNIMERVLDLQSCNKDDNCNFLAEKIKSYLPEWTDR